MPSLEKQRAALELAEAEAAFADGDKTVEAKNELRELRRVFREEHRTPTDDGAQPETVTAASKVNKTA